MVNQKTVELQNKVKGFLASNLPIKGSVRTLDFKEIDFKDPPELDNIDKQLEMRYTRKGSLCGYLRAKIAITDNQTGKEIFSTRKIEQLIPIYYVSDRGTYMINGSDKYILNEMRVRPGVYTSSEKSGETKATLRFRNNSAPLTIFAYDPVKTTFEVRISARGDSAIKSVNGVSFLRYLSLNDTEIKAALGNDYVADELMRSAKTNIPIQQVYTAYTGKAATGGDEVTKSELLEFLSSKADFGESNPAVTQTIGSTDTHLTKDVIIRTIDKMFKVARREDEGDNQDDIRFKEVMSDNDTILEQIKKDFNDTISKIRPYLDDEKKTIENTYEIKSLLNFGNSINSYMSKGALVDTIAQTNPLKVAADLQKITQGGNVDNVPKLRMLKGMGFNRLDPIETPESGKIGIVEHLAQGAKVEDNTIKTAVLKVFGKTVTDSPENTIELDPAKEYDSKVAFFDNRYIRRDGNKIIFLKDNVPGRYQGKETMLNIYDIDYVDKAPQNIMNITANMIPFVHHDDGNRALMGTNMQTQAIPIVGKEVPLVSAVVNGSNTTYEEVIGDKFGKPIKTEYDGVISAIEKSKITVTDDNGQPHVYSYYNYFPGNDGCINNEVIVKVGDRVTKGQIIAEGWQTKQGKLALGTNARVGYMAYKGYNYEDGVVVSRSFANRMASEKVDEYSVEIPNDAIGGPGSNVQEQFKIYEISGELLTNLNKDGIIKEGQTVKPGSVIAAYLRPVQRENIGINLLSGGKPKDKYDLATLKIPETSYVAGTVKRVMVVNAASPNNKWKIVATIASTQPLKKGDKLSGKHGNKGTVSLVLDNDEIPVAQDGKKFDILFSPLAVPSRKNLGQLLECSAGLVAEKTGKQFLVDNFNSGEADRVRQGLAEIGVPDGKMKVMLREKQPDGTITEIPAENDVTVGNTYIMRLKHVSDDKIQSRSNLETNPERKTFMPTKETGAHSGERHNPQSFGEMEMRALQAHGAVYNILESSTVKADGGGDVKKRIAIFEALKTGKIDAYDMDVTPQSLNVLSDTLKGFALNLAPINNGKEVKSVNEVFDSFALRPMKSSEIIKMIGKDNQVTDPVMMDAKASGEDEIRKGSIIDPAIFGEKNSEESRKKWGYVELASPMPNPILLGNTKSPSIYSNLTGVSNEKIHSLMKGNMVLILDPDKYTGSYVSDKDRETKIRQFKDSMTKAGLVPGDLIAPSKLEELESMYGEILWKAGGEGLQYMLDQVDVGELLKTAKANLKVAKSTDINKYYKEVKMLQSLKQNGMQASDLMLKYVPVVPTYLRPCLRSAGDIRDSDLNKLYSGLVSSNKRVKTAYSNGYDMISDANPSEAARDTKLLFGQLSRVLGQTYAIDPRTKEKMFGLTKELTAGDNQAKYGLVRSKMLAKREDFSGRSVITVDPTLSMDEIAIPADMATNIYKPFVIKELIERGLAKNDSEANKKIKARDKDVIAVLKIIAKDRPVCINRAPSLHELSIQAFNPIIKADSDGNPERTIQLNPLVCTAFNADFDGDQMSAHVPVTEKAKEEAKKLMLPSSNLINVTNGELIIEIRHEMALGIYYLTMHALKPEGKPINYFTYDEMRRDYKSGKLKSRQAVNFTTAQPPLKNVTAGYALYILLIPQEYRLNTYHRIDKPWSAREINNMISDMHLKCESTNGKKYSIQQIATLVDKIKELGFYASTRSGVSIGINDFKTVGNIDEMYNNAIKEMSKKHTGKEAITQGAKKVESEIEARLKNGEIVEEDNPVNIMMQSGARGNAGQFRRMLGTVGLGMDIMNNLTAPVRSSLATGLSPEEYWTHSIDSRKGMYDRVAATSEPGAATRKVWAATQSIIITENDCGSTEGISVKKANKTALLGRYSLKRIISKTGKVLCEANQMITNSVMNAIYKDESIENVEIRSPMKCHNKTGVCQHCYGSEAGSFKDVAIGTAVGVIASQAIGEPFTQSTLNTFHGGGTSSIGAFGLPKVNKVLNLAANEANKATLATVSGKITDIIHGINGTYDTVVINGKAHKVPHVDGKPKELRVEVGDTVTKGDFLTIGDISDMETKPNAILSSASPKDIFKLKSSVVGEEEARDYVQNYMLGALNNAVDNSLGGGRQYSGKINQRHLETMVGQITSKVQVIDAGSSPYMKGEVIDKNVADDWNANNASPINSKLEDVSKAQNIVGKISAENVLNKQGQIIIKSGQLITMDSLKVLLLSGQKQVKVYSKPIEYQIKLYTQNNLAQGHGESSIINDNFFSNLASESVMEKIRTGAAYGMVDKLQDPRARLMAGKLLNVGEGVNVSKDKANSASNSLRQMLSKK